MSFQYSKCRVCHSSVREKYASTPCVCTPEVLIYPVSYDTIIRTLDELKRHILLLKEENERLKSANRLV